MAPIRVAVIGVGNCASSLVQGIHYYRSHPTGQGSGITYEDIGGYNVTDIEFVAAWDVDKRKVGKPLNEAIFEKPNCCYIIDASVKDVPGYPVVRVGPVLDGVADHMETANPDDKKAFCVTKDTPDTKEQIVDHLKAVKADMVVVYLPVGSQKAVEFWAEAAIDAKVGFICCIPVFIASDPAWERRFSEAGLVCLGDDNKSQLGASIFSQAVLELAFDRGSSVSVHTQLNVGGNTDFKNMMDQDRLASKKESKESVLKSQNTIRNIDIGDTYYFAGPSTFIDYLGDQKVATIRMEGKIFGGAPFVLDARLQVEDSPNSGGVMVDAVRFLKVAQEMGITGALRGPSAWTQKHPPEQLSFADAKAECDALARRELTDRTRKQVKLA